KQRVGLGCRRRFFDRGFIRSALLGRCVAAALLEHLDDGFGLRRRQRTLHLPNEGLLLRERQRIEEAHLLLHGDRDLGQRRGEPPKQNDDCGSRSRGPPAEWAYADHCCCTRRKRPLDVRVAFERGGKYAGIDTKGPNGKPASYRRRDSATRHVWN